MNKPAATDFPIYDRSDFSGEAAAFHFDLIRLQDNPEVPRAFPHRHNYYHLLWMTEAAGTHMLDFETYEVRRHSVFFVSPGQLHYWNSTVQPRGYVVNFSTEFFVQMFPRAEDIAQFPFFHIARDVPVLYMDAAQHDALLPLVMAMEQELGGKADGRLDVVRSYLLILLTRLRRLYPVRDTPGLLAQNYALTKRYKLLIEQHYLAFGPVRAYADRLHVTERQLNEALKKTIGKTASQLVQDRMVLEAKRLLCNTDLTVAEIAHQLNFEDFAYFCRFFKKHTQLTPGDFKKRVTDTLR